MAGKKRNKDHLKEHAGVELVEIVSPPSDSGDPLRWWTQHPTEAYEVDLQEFAEGQTESPWGNLGFFSQLWAGPFTGRPGLIRELAPHLKAKTVLLGEDSVRKYLAALRYWWRLFDTLETTPLPGGKRLVRVDSVADLNEFHEAGYHQLGGIAKSFEKFRGISNAARAALGLRELLWIGPERSEPYRQLISDDMAKLLRITLKRNWKAVRKDWAIRDGVRAEADRRDRGDPAKDLGPEGERLLVAWREVQRIAQTTGKVLPSRDELKDGRTNHQLRRALLSVAEMRALQFPTVEEVDAAMHVALLDSGWNPSTLINVDASDPNCVAPSLKDPAYAILHAEEDGVVESTQPMSMSAPKPRARGKLQTCHGLAKNTCSAPVIVREMIKRTEPLRELLREQLRDAIAQYSRLQQAGADREYLSKAFKLVQALKRGVRSVWVYVDNRGRVVWVEKVGLTRYSSGDRAEKDLTYLAKVIRQLAATGQVIGKVTPSDLRDLYARRFLRSGGSLIALMLALGHSRLATTAKYVENNVFSTENDEVVRRFLDHLFGQLEAGRVDLTILAQLSRHGPLTDEMAARLLEYRSLMKSRLGVGCIDPRNPPPSVEPNHVPGHFCGGQRCTLCPHARYLPESLDGFAMRAEELMVIADLIPREAWLRLRFDDEQQNVEGLLENLYPSAEVANAREQWRTKIRSAHHRIPGVRLPIQREATA